MDLTEMFKLAGVDITQGKAKILIETKKLTAAEYVNNVGQILNDIEAAYGLDDIASKATPQIKRLIAKAKSAVGETELKAAFDASFKNEKWSAVDIKLIKANL